MDFLLNHLGEFNPLAITGDTPQSERLSIATKFQKNRAHKVLVLSLRVGGLGLNLQTASYVFHFDRWWNPAVEQQAEDRTHRLGQTSKVNVVKYISLGTVEERIDLILRSKKDLFDSIVDDVSLDLDLGNQLNRDEIFGLFNL